MKKEEIHWGDWHRILYGSVPETFLLEVFIRTIFMYLVLLVILRLMGKRMGGQLTISELAVMLTLGAIICVPMQLPDKGLLEGVTVLICALAFQRGLTLIGFYNSKAEKIIQGTESILVKDGVMQIKEIEKSNISRQQLFAVLRSQNIYNLGEIERIYLEACGLFSVYKFETAQPGLSIFPANDQIIGWVTSIKDDVIICHACGKKAKDPQEEQSKCNNCKSEKWGPAIL
jgi:uncharacterized membrane protein YcaP (DUF421 family)